MSVVAGMQAPSNAVALWSVPPLLRPFGMAILIICIHLGGDVPSPPALGWLQSKLGNWRSVYVLSPSADWSQQSYHLQASVIAVTLILRILWAHWKTMLQFCSSSLIRFRARHALNLSIVVK